MIIGIKSAMPKSPNTIQFSLPSELRERLEALGEGGSAALVAKRLVLKSLGADAPAPALDPDELEYLQHQVERLEERLGICPDPAVPDRLDKLEERLNSLPDLSKVAYLQTVLEHLVRRCEEQLNSPPPIAIWESRLGEIEQKLAHISPWVLESPAAVPTPTRLPKATKRKTQETADA